MTYSRYQDRIRRRLTWRAALVMWPVFIGLLLWIPDLYFRSPY